MELQVDLLKQLATVDGLLAGLALAAAVRIVTGNNRSGLISMTIGTLLFASIILVTTASLAALLMQYAGVPSGIPKSVETLSSVFIIVSLLGQSSFLFGIILVGWVWSPTMGKLSAVVAGIAAIVIWLFWIQLPPV